MAFRPDERRKVVEVVGDMAAEYEAGNEQSRPTIYSVVARLHAIRNHPIARRKRAYLEPLVEMVLDERTRKNAAASQIPAETNGNAVEKQPPDASGAPPAPPAPEAEAEAGAGPVLKRRLRKRKRVRHESDSESGNEEGNGGGGGSNAVAPTLIPPNGPKVDGICGMDDVMEKMLYNVLMPLDRGYYYTQPGHGFSKSVLLYGPSGCGKTLLGNAIAAAAGATFFSVSGPDIIGGVSGESETNIRNIFDKAIEMAPSLIFMDDLETIAGKVDQQGGKGSSMEGRIATTLQNSIDRLHWGTGTDKNVVVLAATNNANNLNPFVRRRFDVEVAVSVPNQDAREKILQMMTRAMLLADDVDLGEIARLTPGFVGGDLENVVKTAQGLEIERVVQDELAQFRKTRAPTEVPTGGGGVCAEFLLLKARSAAAGTDTEREVTAPPAEMRIQAQSFREAAQQVVPAAKREGFSTIPDTTWAQVGAMKTVRKKLEMSIIEPIRFPKMYAAAGLKPVGGILLWGPPGCGKTLVAKAVANESKANFISVRGPELLNKYVGESERSVRELFERARAMRPCIIFFDEMDALTAKRDDARSDGSARIVNTLLTELDGLADRSGIFVIGTTNRPDIIDPALKRPGRLGESIFVGPPTAKDRVSILQTLYRNSQKGRQSTEATTAMTDGPAAAGAVGADEEAYMQMLAAVAQDKRCKGFSGADLDHLLRAAGIHCLERAKQLGNTSELQITQEDWETALDQTRPSTSLEELARYKSLE